MLQKLITLCAAIALMACQSGAQTYPDMWYSESYSMYGLPELPESLNKSNFAPSIDYHFYDAQWDCHSEGMDQTGWYKIISIGSLIVNLGDAPAIVDTSLFEWDPCHYHAHYELITSLLKDVNGAVVAGGQKTGYDWADVSAYTPDTLQLAELARYGGWTNPNLQPGNYYPNFGITPGYADPYNKLTQNNWIVLGYFPSNTTYVNPPDSTSPYVGVGDGLYLIESYADFNSLINQGANKYPDGWSHWVEINGMNLNVDPVVPIPAPDPVQNVVVNHDFRGTGASPVLNWDASANATSYDIRRWVGKGNNILKFQEINPVVVGSNMIIDNTVQSAAAALNLNGQVSVIYWIRSSNATGKSIWHEVPAFKL